MSLPHQISTAVILAVGSELLTPERIDTNSLSLTRLLNDLGVDVRYRSIIKDNKEDLARAMKDAISQADLLVTTGGLGSTDDDVTRETVASVFNCPLYEDSEIVSSIRSRFELRGLKMPEINRRQALIPQGAKVLVNDHGTAPGLWMERSDVACLVLPGPPRELEPMFSAVSMEMIKPRTKGERIFRRNVFVSGLTESHVEELTSPARSNKRSDEPCIETSILASPGQVELRLSARSAKHTEAKQALDLVINELYKVLGQNIISVDGLTVEEAVGSMLTKLKWRVAVAESCTGGLVASRLTDIPGSSAYMEAGWTAYSNESKVCFLGVDRDLIKTHGSVSLPVAKAMADGARRYANVECALGITGVAGPLGGSVEKPVGTVCIALASLNRPMQVRQFRFDGERANVKFQASQAALDMLRRALLHVSNG